MKEFKINDYITLKLEEGKTKIYVAGELFEQCKFLLLNIPIKKISGLEEIDSVDEVAENLSKIMEKRAPPWQEIKEDEIEIPPEDEFWAHSSNLQVWNEHKYDTRLIHSNLAFPLLKRLTKTGDPIAKKVFREEIAKKLESGYWPVIEYLIKEDYTSYLSREEFLHCILEDEDEVRFLREIEKRNEITFFLEEELSGEYNNFTVKNRRVEGLCIDSLKIEDILPSISNLKSVETLFLMNSTLRSVPESICCLKVLKKLNLLGNELQNLPNCLGNLINLKNLDLDHNHISKLPKSFEELKLLRKLDLASNKFKDVPKELEKLDDLKRLRISHNPISKNSQLLKDLEKRGIKIIM